MLTLCLSILLFWSIQQRAVVAQTTPENPITQETTQGETAAEIETGGTDAISLQRAPQIEEPVASEEWATANFTGFIDIHQRVSQPDQALLDQGLRFLTTDDFPPFNFRDENGQPVGYHVELARAFCEQLNIACTIKIVPFEQIVQMLTSGQADVALAGLIRHPDLDGVVDFSNIYMQSPARFLRTKDSQLHTSASALDGKPIAVVGGSAHEAYLKAYFPRTNRVPVTNLQTAQQMLLDGKVEAVFADGFQLLPLVASSDSAFMFAGKPYYDAHFFYEGMAMALPAGQDQLRNLLNYGLLKLAQSGRMAELYTRHFALDIFAAY